MIPSDAELSGMDRSEIIEALKKRDAEALRLEASVCEMTAQITALMAEVNALNASVEKLEKELRQKKRFANTFSKQAPKADPKLPGRKPGQGPFVNRTEPIASAVDEIEHLSAPLESADCPQCGTPLEIKHEEASIIDAAPQPTRIIKKFTREVGFCPICLTTHLGHHPHLPDDQRGATAHRLGPNVQALGLGLHYGTGIPIRKVPELLTAMVGITVTQSNLTQSAIKLAAPEAPLDRAYSELKADIRSAKVVNTDDTSWAIAGTAAYLMCFVTETLRVYQIRSQHRWQEVLEMLGQTFRGLLGTDRGPSYDAYAMGFIQMQKCLSHLLKNIKEALKDKSQTDPIEKAAIKFGQELSELLREAIKLWRSYRNHEISGQELKRQREEIHERLTKHLRPRELGDPDAQRLLNGIGERHDNGQVLLFLEHPKIEPTNNSAERGLRGAIIARKVSHCSKNETGAETYAKIKSVVETLRVRGRDWLKCLREVIATGIMPAAGR
jgi:transposase